MRGATSRHAIGQVALEQVGWFDDVVVDADEDQIVELHAHPRAPRRRPDAGVRVVSAAVGSPPTASTAKGRGAVDRRRRHDRLPEPSRPDRARAPRHRRRPRAGRRRPVVGRRRRLRVGRLASRCTRCRLCEYLGIRPHYLDETNIGGASFEVLVEHAAAAVERGQAEVVLVTYGSVQLSQMGRSLGTGGRHRRAVRPWRDRCDLGQHARRQLRARRGAAHARVRHDARSSSPRSR